jgi:hypothetical protein
MKKPSLTDRLIRYVRNNGGWVASGELQRLAMNAGYTPQNAGRRCREITEDGIFEVEYREKNHAWYRYKAQKKTVSEFVITNGVAREIKKTITI